MCATTLVRGAKSVGKRILTLVLLLFCSGIRLGTVRVALQMRVTLITLKRALNELI